MITKRYATTEESMHGIVSGYAHKSEMTTDPQNRFETNYSFG
jgi:hypothetical protein